MTRSVRVAWLFLDLPPISLFSLDRPILQLSPGPWLWHGNRTLGRSLHTAQGTTNPERAGFAVAGRLGPFRNDNEQRVFLTQEVGYGSCGFFLET